MTVRRLVGSCPIVALSWACVTPSALTKGLNHTTPPVSDADRAACVEEVSRSHDQASIQSGYLFCLIAKRYATRLKAGTPIGILPVVVKAPAGFATAKVGQDAKACHRAAYLKVINDHKGQAGAMAAGALVGAPGVIAVGEVTGHTTAPDDVMTTYLDCWRGRGYEAREHHEGEN